MLSRRWKIRTSRPTPAKSTAPPFLLFNWEGDDQQGRSGVKTIPRRTVDQRRTTMPTGNSHLIIKNGWDLKGRFNTAINSLTIWRRNGRHFWTETAKRQMCDPSAYQRPWDPNIDEPVFDYIRLRNLHCDLINQFSSTEDFWNFTMQFWDRSTILKRSTWRLNTAKWSQTKRSPDYTMYLKHVNYVYEP